MIEAKIEQAACRKIKDTYNVKSIKLTPTQSTGYPDRIFFLTGGRPLLIEFKRPGEKPRPKQAYVLNELGRLGYLVTVCTSVRGACRAVDDAIHHNCVLSAYD